MCHTFCASYIFFFSGPKSTDVTAVLVFSSVATVLAALKAERLVCDVIVTMAEDYSVLFKVTIGLKRSTYLIGSGSLLQ